MNIKRRLHRIGPVFPIAIILAAASMALQAQDAVDFFRENCTSCHTIGGGRLTGPDLKNVTQRKDRAWLVQFLQSPQAMIDKGDGYALKLKQEARDVVMPTINGMSLARAELLLSMIETESKLPKSQFVGLQISDRPFTEQDVELGKALFMGHKKLANGGPPCVTCHTFNGAEGFGGGRLGPDLSKAYERLQGRKAMGAWLYAPATPTMNPTFKKAALKADEEILPLLALFESTARAGGEDDRTGMAGFFAAGFVVAVLCLGLFAVIWKARFRGVRDTLVELSARKVLGGRS
ncbi:MAG: c-type cytochrome [Acidobacteria bacterium]|jgi:mono/diheme cytochrome c family protein|nr:c-type cytochrome [Acidobacteriota bacterium]